MAYCCFTVFLLPVMLYLAFNEICTLVFCFFFFFPDLWLLCEFADTSNITICFHLLMISLFQNFLMLLSCYLLSGPATTDRLGGAIAER